MAVVDLVGRLYSSLVVQGVAQSTAFGFVAQNRSNEIQAGGSGLIIPLGMTSIAVQNYADNTPIVYAPVNPGSTSIDVDKKEYVAVEVESIDERQTFMNLLDDGVGAAVRGVSQGIAANWRNTIKTHAYDAAHTHTVSVTNLDDELTNDEIKDLHMTIYDTVAALRSDGFGQRPFVFLPRFMHRAFVRFHALERVGQPTAASENAFRDALLSDFFGADIYADWGDGDDALPIYAHAGITNRTWVWGSQLTETESLRSQDRFATRWRSLLTYGMGNQDNGTAYRIGLVA